MQINLFNADGSIPETQRESWDAMQGGLSKRQEAVLAEIKANPSTLFELSARLNRPVNCVSGRVTELKKRGEIVPVGRRVNPASGKPGIVWGTK